MSSLKKNISSLMVVQAANYLLPLVTVPYLAHVLGARGFGRIAFAQAFAQYFVVLTDFGFTLSATRQVAIVREDSKKLSQLFSAVMTTKLLLMLCGFLLVVLLTNHVSILRQDSELCKICYLSVVGNVMFPVWFLQGMERMERITVFTVGARLLSVVAIFEFVRSSKDIFIAAAIQSSALVLGSIFALVSLPSVKRLSIRLPEFQEIKGVILDSWPMFLSTAAVSLYTSTNTFVLGVETNTMIVGYFSGAEKIVRAVQGLLNPISQSVYPHVVNLTKRSRESGFSFLRKLLAWQSAGMLLVSILLFLSAAPLVKLILGQKFDESIRIIQWLAPLPFLVGVSNVLGIQTMLVFDMKRAFTRIIVTSGLLNVLMLVPLARLFRGTGAAMSVVATETFVTLSMIMILYRTRVLSEIFKNREAL